MATSARFVSPLLCLAALAVGALVSIGEARAGTCDVSQPGWLMCEDFEKGGLGWQEWYTQSNWVECDGCSKGVNDPERIRLEQDVALAHEGEWSLNMPGSSAEHLGGTLRFATCAGEQKAGCALQGHERLYLRTWVRLAADHDYVHHFLGLGGSRPDNYWDANGNAGCRPNGERWAGTRVDLDPEHKLFFYTYFPGMSCDSGGYCSGDYAQQICDGCAEKDMACVGELECCWGNIFTPDPPVQLATETWTCLEMMMQINTPGAPDGSMAFWVDDTLALEVGDMQWRDVPELQLNRAMLEHFIDPGDTDHANRIWFDDVVVSTERIGCAAALPPGDSDGSSGGGDGSGSSGGGDASSGSGTSSTSSGGGGGDGGPSPTDAGTSAPGGDGSGGTTATTAGADTPGAAGCGCSQTRSDGPWFALVAMLGLLRRRARRARQ